LEIIANALKAATFPAVLCFVINKPARGNLESEKETKAMEASEK
jgi:hypothetical protein